MPLQCAPVTRIGQLKERVSQLDMVEDVGKNGLELEAVAFRKTNILFDLQIYVPEGWATKRACPSISV